MSRLATEPMALPPTVAACAHLRAQRRSLGVRSIGYRFRSRRAAVVVLANNPSQLAGTAKTAMKPSATATIAAPSRCTIDLLTLIATRHCKK